MTTMFFFKNAPTVTVSAEGEESLPEVVWSALCDNCDKRIEISTRGTVTTIKGEDPFSFLKDLPPRLTRKQAAEIASCSTRHIDRAIAAGELAAITHGVRHVRIKREDFEVWLRLSEN